MACISESAKSVIREKKIVIQTTIDKIFTHPFSFLFDFFDQIFYDNYQMDKSMPNSRSVTQLVAYWKRNGLSTRASYVLAKAGVSETQLVTYHEMSALLSLKNCGSETAKEIWNSLM